MQSMSALMEWRKVAGAPGREQEEHEAMKDMKGSERFSSSLHRSNTNVN